MSRYARQKILPEIGSNGQEHLSAAHVLVVGVGGLGCPALQYLVGAGLGRITLVDPDVVSLSNLHRQTLFREGDVGQPKAVTAAKTLSNLNNNCQITPIAEALTPANAHALIEPVDLVLDCADSFAVSYILSDICLAQGKPMISASALGFEGYVGGFCGTAPSLRAVFPDLPLRAANCATAGVVGSLVGAIGALQAQLAMSQILGLNPSPLGQVMTLDTRNLRSGGFRFDGAPEPEALFGFITPEAITSTDFVVDLRGLDEAPTPVTDAAHRHCVDDFSTAKPTPDVGQRAVLTCRSGLRAWQAARKLQSYWSGEISLIAMGDHALHSKGPKT